MFTREILNRTFDVSNALPKSKKSMQCNDGDFLVKGRAIPTLHYLGTIQHALSSVLPVLSRVSKTPCAYAKC